MVSQTSAFEEELNSHERLTKLELQLDKLSAVIAEQSKVISSALANVSSYICNQERGKK